MSTEIIPTTTTREIIIGSAIVNAMEQNRRITSNLWDLYRAHGRGPCSLEGCTCRADYKRAIREADEVKAALILMMTILK